MYVFSDLNLCAIKKKRTFHAPVFNFAGSIKKFGKIESELQMVGCTVYPSMDHTTPIITPPLEKEIEYMKIMSLIVFMLSIHLSITKA